MRHPSHFYITLWLLAFGLFLQSCEEQGSEFENQKVKFSITPASTGDGASDIHLPENAHARISIASSNGTPVLSDYDIAVSRSGSLFVTDPVDLLPGSYVVTDFLIMADSADLYVTPKNGAESATSDALPYLFSIAGDGGATVTMRVVDVRDQDLRKFGYASSKFNSLSVAVYEKSDGNLSLTSATAELRQNKTLVQVLSLSADVNEVTLEGDPKAPYTMTVYTATSATSQTFNIKQLKKEIGKNPWQVVLEPALVLTIESYVDQGNENEEYFNFRMDGNGAVNINWGDGEQSDATLPFEGPHEYITGNYTAIVTGDIDQITDFSGFSYGSIISAITGLTHLTTLKVYDPSWGAVPIKVDLSNCKELETINIAKYGAPYEPIDLRTDFKLPTEHHIKTFIFDAPSFDSDREYISAEELESLVNNIYTNTIDRDISNGRFFVNPAVTPSPETQEKIDVLINNFHWEVRFNDAIYDDYSSEGRIAATSDPNAQREQWLRARFSNAQDIIERARVVSSN